MSQTTAKNTTVEVRNVGGIEEAEVEFTPGVSILTGRNATNRTSLLKAINSALGGGKGDIRHAKGVEEGHVNLMIDGAEYTRTFTGKGGVTSGDPYLENEEDLIDNFATLLETNDLRQLIKSGDKKDIDEKLLDFLMQPFDEEEIDRRKAELSAEKERIENEIETIEEDKKRLTRLEEKKKNLEDEIEELKKEKEEAEEEISEIDADKEATERAKELTSELERKKNRLERAKDRIPELEERLEGYKEEKEEIETSLKEAREELDAIDTDRIDDQLKELRDKKNQLNDRASDIKQIKQVTQKLIDDVDLDLFATETEDQKSITSKLGGETKDVLTCPTCGTEGVSEDDIDEQFDTIREIEKEYRSRIRDIEDDIEELKEEKSNLDRKERKVRNHERDLSQIEDDIQGTKADIEEEEETVERLEEEVAELEEELEEAEEQREDRLLKLHRKVGEKESDIDRKETKLEETINSIEGIESEEGRLDTLEEELNDISKELDSLKSRQANVQRDLVEDVNGHMEEVLDILGYENLDRVWIERMTGDEPNPVKDASFDIHVIREGGIEEEDLTNLSESEREVVGLVLALAAYLTHEVYEQVPMILLDSLEAIDAQRIARLIEYFENKADHLIVSLLPEDASELPTEYQRVTADQLRSPVEA